MVLTDSKNDPVEVASVSGLLTAGLRGPGENWKQNIKM